MRLKLFPKIALILTSLATIPVMIVGWQTYSLNKDHLENTILVLHANLGTSLSVRIEQYLNGLVGKVRASIEALRMQGLVSGEALQAFLNSNGEFISIAFINPKGNELLKAVHPAYPEEKKLRDRSGEPALTAYLSQQFNSQQNPEPAFGFYFEQRDPRLSIVLPFDPQNFYRGAFYIVVSLSELWQGIATGGVGVLPADRVAFVVDKDGIVIAHSQRPELALNKTSFAKHPIVAEALLKRTIGSKEYTDEQGRSIIGSYSRVNLTQWVAVIEQPKATAFLPVYETRKRALEIVLLSLAAAALIAFFLAKNLSQPIFSLIDGARKVARGEFDHSVSVKTKDEMSDLATTFNEMVQELKRYNELQVDRLIEEKTKTESIIFSIADGIVLTDQEGCVQLANERAIKIFALSKSAANQRSAFALKHESASLSAAAAPPAEQLEEQSWIGKPLIELMPDPQIKQALRELLSKPESPIVREITIVNADYQQHYQLASELVYTPKTGKKLGVVTVIHDVTLERQMDELKESFLHSITHDLRGPMTSIIGFMKFLLDQTAGPITDQQRQMLQIIDHASTRLLGMINDILDVAKIEAGKLEIEPLPVQLNSLIEEVKLLYQPLADKKAIQLNAALPPNAPAESFLVNGDANQIERVIGNLVANAIKFTPTSGLITVSLEDFPDRVRIAVQDNGPGIPDEDKEKIFDKFQQVKGQKRGGTGLGLTICKYFVELHQGKIWVESEIGKGSRFVFWIPKGLQRSASGEIVCEKVAAT